MSSTPNVTISLNPTGSKISQSVDKSRENKGLEGASKDNAFAKLVDKARQVEATDSGNDLPREAVGEPKSANIPKTIDVNLNDLMVRREGRLKLITGESLVSEESLIEFMREQGFSRAEMAEILMARQDPKTQIAGEQSFLTGNWLQMQGLNQALGDSDSLSLDGLQAQSSSSKPLNLAEALAAQLMEPKMAEKTSAIVDIVVTRDVLAGMMRLTDEGKTETQPGTTSKTLDLSTLLARVDNGQSGLGGQSMGQEAGSGFERGERMMADAQSASQKPQEFREFLAEHLRRADSLKELSDRLGTMLARQMNAHIARGSWRLEMTLHPAELGSIEVDMEMTERGLEASFRANQSVTRDLLMESMARLKSWFEEGGIDVAYAGLTQDSGAETGGNSTSDESSEQTDERDAIEVSDTESGGGAVTDPHRLDIRV